MKVLLYCRAFPPAIGGMERFTESLATWLADQGIDVRVATGTRAPPGSDAQRPYVVRRGVSAVELSAEARWANVVHVNGLALRALTPVRLMRRRPIVTHTGFQAICPSGLAWSPTGICVAGSLPGPCDHCPRRRGVDRALVVAHRVGTKGAGRNVMVSHYLHGRLALPNSVTIYNPVSPRTFGPVTAGHEQDGLVAFAGRLVAEKGLDLVIQAIVALPEVRLEVGGDGPMRSAWEALAQRMGVGDRVKFLGRLGVHDVVNLYTRAAVVCVPSVWNEPFGYAAAEAMAMGKVVMATPRGALPELLDEGRGFVASACTPQAVAQSLDAALREQGGAGARAREFAHRELDIDNVGAQYLRVYEEVAA